MTKMNGRFASVFSFTSAQVNFPVLKLVFISIALPLVSTICGSRVGSCASGGHVIGSVVKTDATCWMVLLKFLS
jgi:hypothetical protein